VQDGFAIYHHTFFFTPDGQWCVVQQGMDEGSGWARRYHWLAESVDDFVCEPHEAVHDLADRPTETAASQENDPPQTTPARNTPAQAKGGGRQLMLLNMVAGEAGENRRASAALVRERPDWLFTQIERFTEGPTLFAPARHPVLKLDVNRKRLKDILTRACEQSPRDFETLLGIQGVGPATVRSLALLAEVIFQAPPSRRDPTARKTATGPSGKETIDDASEARRWADYSYAHGGKDGTPFRVDQDTYDRNILVLTDAVRRARLGQNDKLNALRRLSGLGQV
jgi:hypothetical protein